MPDLDLGSSPQIIVRQPGIPTFEVATLSTTVTVLPVRGPAGRTGGPGVGGGGYEHVQDTPAATWSITPTTPFDRLPAVALYVDGEPVETDLHVTATSVTATFPEPIAGTAVLT